MAIVPKKKPSKQKPNRGKRIGYWLVFNVLFAFAPIILGMFIFLANGDANDTLRFIVHGEAAIICIAIAADAIGDLWMTRKAEDTIWNTLAFIGCILVVAFGGIWYIVIAKDVKYTLNTALGSIILTIFTLFASGVGKWRTTEA